MTAKPTSDATPGSAQETHARPYRLDPEDESWQHGDVAVYSYPPYPDEEPVRVTVGFRGGDRTWHNVGATGGPDGVTHRHIRNKGGLTLLVRDGLPVDSGPDRPAPSPAASGGSTPPDRCPGCLAPRYQGTWTCGGCTPTPCPRCSLPTWDGLHRNGHELCHTDEVEVAP